jgi:hypothetical protein
MEAYGSDDGYNHRREASHHVLGYSNPVNDIGGVHMHESTTKNTKQSNAEVPISPEGRAPPDTADGW